MAPRHPYEGVIAGEVFSGNFCDMRIVCDGRLFKVHQNVVCAQSSRFHDEVMNTNQFEDGMPLVEVEYSSSALEHMLDYFYCEDYEVFPRGVAIDLFEIFQPAETQASNMSTHYTYGLIPTHMQVNELAAHYMVFNLADLALQKIKTIVDLKWDRFHFVEAFYHCFQYCTDTKLHTLVINLIAENYGDLATVTGYSDWDFPKLYEYEVAYAIAKRMGQTKD